MFFSRKKPLLYEKGGDFIGEIHIILLVFFSSGGRLEASKHNLNFLKCQVATITFTITFFFLVAFLS
jgi:hypothetical protein